MKEQKIICEWIGDGEKCRQPRMVGSSYCEEHHGRVYTTLLPEMATYIIEKELKIVMDKSN